VKFEPEILLIGGTSFGRELAPRVAKRLSTGLTADCIDLNINDDGLMVMTAPSFGGHLLADIITPEKRPQMATVRPGTFKELSHNDDLKGEIINIELPGHLHNERIRLVSSTKLEPKGQSLEKADVVIIGGRGMGSSDKFDKLKKLAGLLDAEVGATRPAVFSGWIEHDRLIGQAGRSVSPKVLFTFGTSGAVQHTAAINDAEFVIAVNKNPDATMMKMADAAIIADTDKFLPALIKELEDRLAEKNAK
jgi:electron transfer flavoprotein alpha subunit